MKLSLILGAVALACAFAVALGPVLAVGFLAAGVLFALAAWPEATLDALGTAFVFLSCGVAKVADALLVIGGVLLLMADPAMAQTIALPGGFAADVFLPGMQMLGALTGPMIVAVVWIGVTRILAFAEKLGAPHLDAKHTAALHEAVVDAVRVLLAHGEPVAAQTIADHVGVGNVAKATQMVFGLAPAAVAHLGIGTEQVEGLVTACLGDVLAGVAPAAPSEQPAAPACTKCGATDGLGCIHPDCPSAPASDIPPVMLRVDGDKPGGR